MTSMRGDGGQEMPVGSVAHSAHGSQDQARDLEPIEWGSHGRDAIMRIPVIVRFVLGSVRMPVSKLMSLTRGSIVPLDRKVGDLVDIVVNDRVIARGEVVVLDEQASRFAISVQQVVETDDAA